ncbi:MarR family winged helix-turn-helix transcriptional regulator [Actinospongicola halichondriae]|uniref:MarR family winged helix-turn-helix transcriptional regulator n=1 Tax=Actinospongicola halichondriae TaxID=3236844 RepID=UPI003D58991F
MKTNESTVAVTAEHVRAIARLARVFETRLTGESMTLPQFRVLAFLSEGEWAASALAEWLDVSRPSVTALVDGLVERGWVGRRESPDDRRRVLHQITDEGKAALVSSTSCLADGLDGLLDHLGVDERTDVLRGLDGVVVALRRHRAEKHA